MIYLPKTKLCMRNLTALSRHSLDPASLTRPCLPGRPFTIIRTLIPPPPSPVSSLHLKKLPAHNPQLNSQNRTIYSFLLFQDALWPDSPPKPHHITNDSPPSRCLINGRAQTRSEARVHIPITPPATHTRAATSAAVLFLPATSSDGQHEDLQQLHLQHLKQPFFRTLAPLFPPPILDPQTCTDPNQHSETTLLGYLYVQQMPPVPFFQREKGTFHAERLRPRKGEEAAGSYRTPSDEPREQEQDEARGEEDRAAGL